MLTAVLALGPFSVCSSSSSLPSVSTLVLLFCLKDKDRARYRRPVVPGAW